MLETGDHVRAPTRSDGVCTDLVPGATYRVVGAETGLALLRVTDGRGRRAYTGEVALVTDGAALGRLEATADPDTGLALRHRLRTLGSGLYWSIRRFLP